MARARLAATFACAVLAFGGIAHVAWATVTRGDLVYHGGPVMHHATVYPIFWIPPGAHFYPHGSGPDTRYENLQMRFLHDVSFTPYFSLVTQYFDGGGHIEDSFITHAAFIDTAPYPAQKGSVDAPLLRQDIDREVMRLVAARHWHVDPRETLFIVYTTLGTQTCDDQGSPCSLSLQRHNGGSGVCGYHRSFVSRGVRYADALISDEPVPCQDWQVPLTDATSPNHDVLGDIAADITSHELFESLTDPYGNAWTAGESDEIADKCAAAAGPRRPDHGDVVLHGHSYLLQEEWSNEAGRCVLTGGQ